MFRLPSAHNNAAKLEISTPVPNCSDFGRVSIALPPCRHCHSLTGTVWETSLVHSYEKRLHSGIISLSTAGAFQQLSHAKNISDFWWKAIPRFRHVDLKCESFSIAKIGETFGASKVTFCWRLPMRPRDLWTWMAWCRRMGEGARASEKVVSGRWGLWNRLIGWIDG